MKHFLINSNGLLHRIIFRARQIGFPVRVLRVIYWSLLGMRIGKETSIQKLFVTWPHQVSIGRNCRLEHHIYFHFDGIYRSGPSIEIGDNTFIGSGCEFNVKNEISIGNHCSIASGCRFIDHSHDISGKGPFVGKDIEDTIRISDYVWLGANVIVLKGVTIGEGAVVAANAVVTKSVPRNEIWAGVPAKRINQRG
jgi:acetyltransferase-like isoleucine patch superfamily enzyme